MPRSRNGSDRTSLVVQWLGLWASTAGDMSSIPGQGSSTCCGSVAKKREEEMALRLWKEELPPKIMKSKTCSPQWVLQTLQPVAGIAEVGWFLPKLEKLTSFIPTTPQPSHRHCRAGWWETGSREAETKCVNQTMCHHPFKVFFVFGKPSVFLEEYQPWQGPSLVVN